MAVLGLDEVVLTGVIPIEHILSLQVTAEVNHHARMELEGYISEQTAEEFAFLPLEGKEMTLFCGEDQTRPFFCGPIVRAAVTAKDGLFIAKVTCLSGSYRFDLKKRCRSFQDTDMTYGEMMKQIAKEAGGNIVSIVGKASLIGMPLLQYMETDWEFVNRMASRFGSVVIPETTNGFPQMSMGVVNGTSYEIDDNAEYEIMREDERYRVKSAVNTCAFQQFYSYRVNEGRNLMLGDKVTFLGKQLTVMKKEALFANSGLELWYTLGYEQCWGHPRYTNSKISGMSLTGTVLATEGERLRISLDIDGEDTLPVEKHCWYRFAAITDDIFYCMPEIGAGIVLYFPTDEEKDAQVISCLWSYDGENSISMDAEVRQLKTKDRRVMLLSPDEMVFHGDCSSMQLLDGKGVSIDAQADVCLEAEGKITVQGKKITVEAAQECTLTQTDTGIGIEMSGATINKYAPTMVHMGAQKAYPNFSGGAAQEGGLSESVIKSANAMFMGAYARSGIESDDKIIAYNNLANKIIENNKKMDRLLVQYNYTRRQEKRPEFKRQIDELLKINKDLIRKMEENKKWLNENRITSLQDIPKNFQPDYWPWKGQQIGPPVKLSPVQKNAIEEASHKAWRVLRDTYYRHLNERKYLFENTYYETYNRIYNDTLIKAVEKNQAVNLLDKLLDLGQYCFSVYTATKGVLQDGGSKGSAIGSGLTTAIQSLVEGDLASAFGAGPPSLTDLANFLGLTTMWQEEVGKAYETRRIFTGNYGFFLSGHCHLFCDKIDELIEEFKNVTNRVEESKKMAVNYLNSLKAINLLSDETKKDIDGRLTRIEDKYRGWSVSYG